MSENWTTDNIPDLSGKVIIVTGANSGIGFEAAKELARKGGYTILACRSMEKGQDAAQRIRTEVPQAPLEPMVLDLASLNSVRAFAENFMAAHNRLDLLINNAGIMWVPQGKTEDGFENQFGTNHLGHFALTGLLIELLTKTPGARVVNISSVGHRAGVMDFDNLMFEKGEYGRHPAYGRSKLANLLFTYELQRRFDTADVNVIATAAHPGGSSTNLSRHVEGRWYFRLLRPLMEWMSQSAAMGALPTLRAATDPNAKGGDYYGPDGFYESRGYPVLVESSAASHSQVDAQRLWEVSQELTAVRFL
jgi:NAD(P)-dependent dehydrogenase (short-subunit alcohol dehydrogenase family)